MTLLSIPALQTGTPTRIPEIANDLLPGHPLPKAASCDSGDNGFRYMSYCHVFQEGVGPVYFTYDQQLQAIRSTILDVNSLYIGDLLPAWGNPQGYRHDNGTIQIYWGNRIALLSGSLTPSSPVRAIIYRLDADLPQDSLLPWRGFVTDDILPTVTNILKS